VISSHARDGGDEGQETLQSLEMADEEHDFAGAGTHLGKWSKEADVQGVSDNANPLGRQGPQLRDLICELLTGREKKRSAARRKALKVKLGPSARPGDAASIPALNETAWPKELDGECRFWPERIEEAFASSVREAHQIEPVVPLKFPEGPIDGEGTANPRNRQPTTHVPYTERPGGKSMNGDRTIGEVMRSHGGLSEDDDTMTK
jgi:hypothetical protein